MTMVEEASPVRNQDAQDKRPPNGKTPRCKPKNPIAEAVESWLGQIPQPLLSELQSNCPSFQDKLPKRWVVYAPMVLLPSGSFNHAFWTSHSGPGTLRQREMEKLWVGILETISRREGKGPLTHLAVNAGIPLNRDPGAHEENVLRSPSGLGLLYGDFGAEQSRDGEDFDAAFWVRTKQNGVVQVWAPKYTMFSRGNVKEKARLLDFHRNESGDESKRKSFAELEGHVAVDLYAGIGYFVFSYVKMGLGKVVGWELNPWSVEGLRRGAVANGWRVRVVKEGEGLKGVLESDEEIVVFLGDNSTAGETLRLCERQGRGVLGKVMHVNCGLLPTSFPSWEMALGIVRSDGWLHLHENVGVADIERRRGEIEDLFKGWLRREEKEKEKKKDEGNLDAIVDHVELVKTFAPGVWHCVFDVHITKSTS